MKKGIIILWAMLFSFCTWAQGSERLRDHQIPAKLEGFFKYADSLGYRANVHYIQRETRKVSVSFSHFVRKDENVALLLDSVRHTFHALADEAQETFFWESHKDGVDSVEYALHLDKGNLKFTYKPSSLVYLDFMYQVDSIKHPITEKIDKRGYWKMLKEVLKRKGVSKQKFYIYLNDKDKAKTSSTITVNVINGKKQDTLKVVMESIGEGLFRSKNLITAVPTSKDSRGSTEISFFAGDTIYVEYQDPDDEEDHSRITAFFAESNYPTPQKVLAMDSDCDNKADKLVVYFSNTLDETFSFTQMKVYMDGMKDTALVSVPQPVTGLSEVTVPLAAER